MAQESVTYQPRGLALEIFQSRHALHPAETWDEACHRVASVVANAETGEARAAWAASFERALRSNKFMPGGGIWYGGGRPRGQLLNCFVIPISDSREGWGRAVSDSLVIAGTGGGVGLAFTPSRPRGQPIRGTGGSATGAVSVMEIINAAGEVIKAGGGRRTALMFGLGLRHGDLPEFLDAKLDLKKLNNANVSVIFEEDPRAFLAAVDADEEWVLQHQGREVGRVRARELWEKIVGNALIQGEPGVLNGHLANRMSNIHYLEALTCTNPCGEIWMSPYDCCCLGSLVLPRFVDGRGVRWEDLREHVRLGIRFLDDVLSVNNYPLPEIAAKCSQLRRVGLGIMGLAHMLIELGLRYDSPQALEFVDKLMKFIKNASYQASVDLAREKGPFPAFDPDQYLRGAFIKTLRPTLRQEIRQYGVRNCANNTIAPTGTISMVCDVSSGIEPIYSLAYERRFRKGDDHAMEEVVDPLYQRYVDEGRDVSAFTDALNMPLRAHFEMQATCQRHVDNAVSKTINVWPSRTSPAELAQMYAEFLPELKGVTVYPEGSRPNQPLTPLPLDRALELARSRSGGTGAAAGRDCRSGVCDL